jgi:pimeloyl-ACP methyl ester carboxylesterase
MCLILSGFPAFLCAEDQFFNSAGVRIHYIVDGKGESVILLHPLGLTAASWQRIGITQELSSHYRVIAIDIRGHGESDKPHNASAYGTNMSDDVIRLMDQLKIKKAHVVGYSLGGFITEYLVAYHANRLLTATIGGAGWEAPEVTARVANQVANALEQGKSLGPAFPAGNDLPALAALARGLVLFPPIPEDRFSRVKIPTLTLVGGEDPAKTAVDRLATMIPATKVVVIPGKIHTNAPDDPLFLSSVKTFLAAHAKASANPQVRSQ